MLKKVFFINHAPKEFHNLLVLIVIIGMLFSTVFLFNGTYKKKTTTTIEASEKAVKASYDEFVKDGYNGTVEDFKKLLKNSEEATQMAIKLTKKAYPTINTRNFDLGSFAFGDKGYEQKFRMKMGLPFEYYYSVPDWEIRFLAFGFCWGGTILILLLVNFTLKPIANKYKYFWILPYLILVIIPLFWGFWLFDEGFRL